MCNILLVKKQVDGYMKAEETSIKDLWDMYIPDTLREYNIEMVR